MENFLLAVFLDDTFKEYKLNSLHTSEFNSDIELHFNLKNIHFNNLFLEKNKKWYIHKNELENVTISCNGNEVNEKLVEHGDYFIIRDQANDIQFQLLLTFIEKHSLSNTKYKLKKDNNLFIGRLLENDICFSINNAVSRKHAAIRFEQNCTAFIEDVSRKTGVFVNGVKVSSAELHYGDIIFIMGLKMVFLGDCLSINGLHNSCSLSIYKQFLLAKPAKQVPHETFFTRSPRIVKTLEKSEYEIDAPPGMQKRQQMPLILTMGPSLTMSVAMIVSLVVSIVNARSGGSVWASGAMAVSMLLGAIFWPLMINSYQKRQEAREEYHRIKRYKEYIYEQKIILEEKKQRNIKILTDVLFPEPKTILGFFINEDSKRRLWEKTPSDEDFLEVMLGIGEREFDVKVTTPEQGFMLHEDPLIEEPKKLAEEYKMLRDVPITLSLYEHKLIGLFGCKEKVINNAKCVALNLAGLHSYEEVKMVFVYYKNEANHFEWVKELPHVWSGDRSLRYVATNKEEVHQLFMGLDEIFREREHLVREGSPSKSIQLPKYVFFISDDTLVENEPLLRYLTNPENPVGVSSLFIYGQLSKLPKDCDVLIQNDSNRCGIYYKNKYNNRLVIFRPNELRNKELLEFAKNLSKLKIKSDNISLNVPEKVTFLGMYKAGNVDELQINRLWNQNASYKSLAVPIGIKAGGDLFSLDIHENYHGPHGLVAGMTGSGKSEFLQAFIASAAINYHPHDFSFVLIDYKGGGMANIFDGMPHIAGKITNLSGSQLNRSLISIRAELKRRQHLFNRYGINHIDKYQRLYKEGTADIALPHLAIISDEFAQLKTQQPDFMRELIDVAQIGRSLGIHLILATQKPAGVVDEQIWGNSRFRVCLKVLDKHDSNEMIRKPDAALIKQPGRAYVQVGYDEIFEYLQSGYSGIDYAPTPGYLDEEQQTVSFVDSTATPLRVAKMELSGPKTGKSQLESIIDSIKEIANNSNIKGCPLWLEPLKERINISELKDYVEFNGKWLEKIDGLTANIGLADFPEQQKQEPVAINLLHDGHTIIYGASGTGKTTFLQTLIYSLAAKYSPDVLNLYILDFGGRSMGYFSKMPHCQDMVFADDEDKLDIVLEKTMGLIEERKILFAENNVGSYEAYLTISKTKLPAVVFVIDNYSILRERYFNKEDTIVNLVANGKTYGIFFVITGNSKNAVYYKVTDHVSNFFTLRLNDPLLYREILGTPTPLEPDNLRGRGLTVIDGVVEFQTALVVDTEDEAERARYIQIQIEKMLSIAGGSNPKPINRTNLVNPVQFALSSKTTATSSNSVKPNNSLELIEPGEHVLHVGNLQRRNTAQGLPFASLHTFLISGSEKTRKTDYLKFLIKTIKEVDKQKIVLIDRSNFELEEFAKSLSVNQYITSSSGFDTFVKDFEETVRDRLYVYQEVASNLDSEEVYGYMQRFEKLFICINGFLSFFEMISDEALEIFQSLIAKCKGLNIYFITLENSVEVQPFSSTEIYIYLIKAKHGIFMGGNINKQSIFVFEEMSYHERELELVKGEGIFFNENKYAVVKVPSIDLEVAG